MLASISISIEANSEYLLFCSVLFYSWFIFCLFSVSRFVRGKHNGKCCKPTFGNPKHKLGWTFEQIGMDFEHQRMAIVNYWTTEQPAPSQKTYKIQHSDTFRKTRNCVPHWKTFYESKVHRIHGTNVWTPTLHTKPSEICMLAMKGKKANINIY